MTLVILGTQDKEFTRMIKMVEKQVKNGNLKDVIVQAGLTKYKSDCMQIFDLISMRKFNKLIKESDFIITHGGVGSILTSLQNNKKVIAIPRLSKYKEHENDHQLQIVEEFTKLGYILSCNNDKQLEEAIINLDKFKPKKYKSNNKKMINIIEDYIDNL